MMEREFKDLGIKVYTEELDNGLKVFLILLNDRKNYYVEYLTKFGAEINEFKSRITGKRVKVPYGVAHFLEHKMFEQEDGVDPFSFYSKSGVDANASTGYKETTYTLEGVDNIEDNIDFLINYVNSPYFTDENVEKEKGIIIEELNMYKDQPENKLYDKNNKSLFKYHPFRRDIGGTPKSVRSITKENLYECYETFYQPSNMIMAVAGNFDKDRVLNIIKSNKKLNSKKENCEIITYKVKETLLVNSKENSLKINNLIIPKFALSIKSFVDIENGRDRYKFIICIDILLYILFGSSSEFREEMLENNFYSLFYFSSVLSDNLLLIEFICESKVPSEFKEKIMEQFKYKNFSSKDVERIKKVKISLEVMNTDKPYRILDTVTGHLLDYGEVIYDKMDIIRNISFEDIMNVRKKICFDNYSFTIGYPKK